MLAAVLGLVVASITAHARLLNQCLGLGMTLGVLLLIVPGLNLIGLLLLIVSAVMVLMGECRKCTA